MNSFNQQCGVGLLLSPSDLMKAWKIGTEQYEAWIAEGLPVERLVDGSFAHFAVAVDEWCRTRVKAKSNKSVPVLRSKWLGLRDAAALLGLSARQLSRYADQGEIAHKRKPGRGRGGRGEYLFARDDINRFNARTTVPARTGTALKPRRPPVPTKVFIDPKICGRSFQT